MKAQEEYFQKARVDQASLRPQQKLALLLGTYATGGPPPNFGPPLTAAEEELQRDPHSRLGLNVAIASLRMLGMMVLAMDMVDEALALYPEDEEFWTLRALCLSKDDPAVCAAADRAIQLGQSPNIIAWLAKLAFLCDTEKTPLILAAIKEAQALFPQHTLFEDLERYYTKEQHTNVDADD